MACDLRVTLAALTLCASGGCFSEPPAITCQDTACGDSSGTGDDGTASTAGTTSDTMTAGPSSTAGETTMSDGGTTGPGGDPLEECAVLYSPLTYDSASLTVSNERLQLTFNDAGAVIGLRAVGSEGAGENLLDQEADPETFMSVGAFPDWYAWQDMEAAVEAFEDNGIMRRFEVTWRHLNEVDGRSVYTILADGRVHRYDEVTPVSPTPDLWLNTYAAFRPDAFDEIIDAEGEHYPVEDLLNPGDNNYFAGWNSPTDGLCGRHSSDFSVVGYTAFPSPAPTFDGIRGTRSNFMGDTLAFQTDWVRSGMLDGTYTASTMFFVESFGGDDQCGCALNQIDAYRHPPPIELARGSFVGCAANTDTGYCERFGHYRIAMPADGNLEMTFMGEAATVVMAVENTNPESTVSIVPERVLPQSTSDDGTLFLFFPHGLRSGDQITITP